MGFLQNKKILIAGIASKKSIAYGCAVQMQKQGATLAFTYPNERLKDRIEKMANDMGVEIVLPCDVSNDENIKNLFTSLAKKWGNLDGLVHSIAFADKNELNGNFVDVTSKKGFAVAHDISSYSLTAMVREAMPYFTPHNASVVTMTYLGATRAIPHYNVMGVAKASLEANMRYLAYSLGEKGIRVNAISAGPVRTLAAAGISDFHLLLDHVEKNAPLRRNITIEEVGNGASFLLSDLSSGITGEIMFIDSGFNMSALAPPK
jgi:enoyl-[acyl-carrier protein] reductase I